MKLFSFFLIAIVSALSVIALSSYLLKSGLKKSDADFYGKIGAACDNKKGSNVIMVGNSRVMNHLDPRIFDSATKLTSYNYGISAAAIKTCYNIIKAAIQNQKTAKAVVLNIDYNMFRTTEDPYKDAYYYPFEEKIPGLLKTDSGNVNLIHSLNIFDISLFDDMSKYAAFNGWLHPHSNLEGIDNGYLPAPNTKAFIEPLEKNIRKSTTPMTANGVFTFTEIIKTCKTNKVLLILVIAPYYKKYHPRNFISNYDSIINQVKLVAIQNNLTFLDYSSSHLSTNRGNFYNYNHLNIGGAALYSNEVADTLKKLIACNK